MSTLSEALAKAAEIRARADEATMGPWRAWSGGGYVSIGIDRPCEIAAKVEGSVYGDGLNQNAKNYIFAAHAREDVPLLLDALEEARRLLRRARHRIAHDRPGGDELVERIDENVPDRPGASII